MYNDHKMSQEELAKYATHKLGATLKVSSKCCRSFPIGYTFTLEKYVPICTSNGVLDDVAYEHGGVLVFPEDVELVFPEDVEQLL